MSLVLADPASAALGWSELGAVMLGAAYAGANLGWNLGHSTARKPHRNQTAVGRNTAQPFVKSCTAHRVKDDIDSPAGCCLKYGIAKRPQPPQQIATPQAVNHHQQMDWQRQQAINVDGVFLSVRHAIAPMRQAGGGSIIIMSSVAGLRGAAGLAGYSATKGAVRYFTKSAAIELVGDGIRVNSVHPGVIETAIWGKMNEAQRAKGINTAIDPHDRVKSIVPAGVMGQPQDIADGVLFLASDASRYMTGAELVIDGGMTAGAAAGSTNRR